MDRSHAHPGLRLAELVATLSLAADLGLGQHLAALRGALKAAWRLGMVNTEDYLRAVDLRPVAGSRLSAGRDVEQGELGALIEASRRDDRPAGVRDAAVIALAYLSGARRGAIAGLQVGDVEIDPPSLRVLGKGNKQRLVPLSPSAGLSWPPGSSCGETRRARCSAASTGRETSGGRPPHRRGDTPAPGPTCPGGRGGPHLPARPAAQLPRGPSRRRCGSSAVQQLLRHASPAATSRYDRRGDKARRAAAERLHPELPCPQEGGDE